MPAVTVPDTLALPRIETTAEQAAAVRSVASVTDAPSGFEGEGFPVRRAFAGVSLSDLDPFVHMDQMGEVEYAPGEPKGTPWHPHRGFETVTYMIDGTFQHQDSIGGGGLITNGSTQWMTAGSGILHIERPPDQLIASGGLFHGTQLWVNLPAADKLIDPRYQNLDAGNIVLLTSPDGGALVRVIAGDVAGHRGPGATHTPISMVHASIEPGAELVLPWPREFNALLYVLSGAGTVGAEARPVHTGQLIVHGPGEALVLRAERNPGITTPGARRAHSRWSPHRRARVRPRPLRHEHARGNRAGLRGLRGGPAGHGPRRPHRPRVATVTTGDAWGDDDIGDLTGRVALVTGANSGIGFETTRALAEHGAHVVMACRDEAKARRAYDELDNDLSRSSLEVLTIDLADLGSVRDAAASFLARHARLDLLVNNAGVMGAPHQLTADGFELHMATNHLGHFALTGLLLDRIVTTERSRIVGVSSHVHRIGRLRADDVAGARIANPWEAYGTSKLANLLFVAELQRRLARCRAADHRRGGAPGLDPEQPGRQRCRPEGRPGAQEAGAGRRDDDRTTHGGGSPARPLRRDLVVRARRAVRRARRPAPALGAAPRGHAVATAPATPADAAALWSASEELTGVRYTVGVPA